MKATRDPLTDAGLAGWEGEGANGMRSGDVAGGALPCFPALPDGYSAQEAWSFRDPTGVFSYEFHRVYGPADEPGARGPTCHLDEGRSYWVVMWGGHGTGPDSHSSSRWLTFARARQQSHAPTFRRFSSPFEMRDEIGGLLGVAGIVLEPALAPRLSAAA